MKPEKAERGNMLQSGLKPGYSLGVPGGTLKILIPSFHSKPKTSDLLSLNLGISHH